MSVGPMMLMRIYRRRPARAPSSKSQQSGASRVPSAP